MNKKVTLVIVILILILVPIAFCIISLKSENKKINIDGAIEEPGNETIWVTPYVSNF